MCPPKKNAKAQHLNSSMQTGFWGSFSCWFLREKCQFVSSMDIYSKEGKAPMQHTNKTPTHRSKHKPITVMRTPRNTNLVRNHQQPEQSWVQRETRNWPWPKRGGGATPWGCWPGGEAGWGAGWGWGSASGWGAGAGVVEAGAAGAGWVGAVTTGLAGWGASASTWTATGIRWRWHSTGISSPAQPAVTHPESRDKGLKRSSYYCCTHEKWDTPQAGYGRCVRQHCASDDIQIC